MTEEDLLEAQRQIATMLESMRLAAKAVETAGAGNIVQAVADYFNTLGTARETCSTLLARLRTVADVADFVKVKA